MQYGWVDNAMDDRSLVNFLKLSETLHFGRAAEACHLSPSALSRCIQRLESELGVTLVERDNRRVRLTHEGKLFENYARQAAERRQQLEARLNEDSGDLHGQLSVYCSVTASYSILSELLAEFRRRHPCIEIKLHTGDQAQAIGRVLNGDDDFVIAARPEKLSTRLRFRVITQSSLLFVGPTIPCAVNDLLVSYERHFEELPWESLPLIVAEEGLIRSQLDAWIKSRQIKPYLYAQVSGNEAIASMIALGCGVGVVPELVIRNSPIWDKIVPLDFGPRLPPLEIGACVLKTQLKNPVIDAFWRMAAQIQLNEAR
jgi:LysR family positive regulator for ilvC